MGKKKVSAPVYEELKDTEYISGLRDSLNDYKTAADNAYNNLASMDKNYYNNLAEQANAYAWNDWQRNAQKLLNQNYQRNYNRFGSLGSTGAQYNQESLSRDINNAASQIASNTASTADQYFTNAYNRNLATAGALDSRYNTAGNTLQTNDANNWNIRNKNIEAKYVADVQNSKSGWNWGGMISGAANGAGTGASVGGGWGALAGGIIGGVTGGLGGDSNSSSTFGQLAGAGTNWLQNKWKAQK